MSATDIIINRDEDNDVLYVIKKDFKGKITQNIGTNLDITIRLDYETKKIVGFTIESFSKIFPNLAEQKEYILMEFFESLIESLTMLLNASHLMPSKV